MNVVVKSLIGDLSTEFGVRIERVERTGDRWRLRCDAGFEYDGFDRVVVAVPPAQAVPLLNACPALVARIAGVRMWPCHAHMLAFESALDVDFDGAYLDGDVAYWATREDSKDGREGAPRWLVHSRADWSEHEVELPVEEAGARIEAAFARSLGVELPPVIFRSTHRWLYARAVRALDDETLYDPAMGIGVCGDWLRGDCVEDAFLSAEGLADAILATTPGA